MLVDGQLPLTKLALAQSAKVQSNFLKDSRKGVFFYLSYWAATLDHIYNEYNQSNDYEYVDEASADMTNKTKQP